MKRSRRTKNAPALSLSPALPDLCSNDTAAMNEGMAARTHASAEWRVVSTGVCVCVCVCPFFALRCAVELCPLCLLLSLYHHVPSPSPLSCLPFKFFSVTSLHALPCPPATACASLRPFPFVFLSPLPRPSTDSALACASCAMLQNSLTLCFPLMPWRLRRAALHAVLCRCSISVLYLVLLHCCLMYAL